VPRVGWFRCRPGKALDPGLPDEGSVGVRRQRAERGSDRQEMPLPAAQPEAWRSTAAPLPWGLCHLKTQRARREVELASVRDCHDDPHRRSHTGGAHSSSRLAPVPLTPVRPALNLTAHVGVPRPKTAPEWFVRLAASRRRRARRALGRRGAGLPGACPAPPASPGSRGCQPRSASARWRPSRSSLPCPGAGCRNG
jgi:hypothetical protein